MNDYELVCAGSQQYKLDEKNRMVFPLAYRDVLFDNNTDNAVVYLIINQEAQLCDRCLLCMTEDEFADYYARLKRIPRTSPAFRLVRHILASASKITIDKQWKLQLPQKLKEYAGIEGMTEIIWSGDYLEIWSPERLCEKQNLDYANAEAAAAFVEAVNGNADADDYESKKRSIMHETDLYLLEAERLRAKMAVDELKGQMKDGE